MEAIYALWKTMQNDIMLHRKILGQQKYWRMFGGYDKRIVLMLSFLKLTTTLWNCKRILLFRRHAH